MAAGYGMNSFFLSLLFLDRQMLLAPLKVQLPFALLMKANSCSR